MQIKRFFASLVQRDVRPGPGDDRTTAPDRIVSVENLALTNPELKNREILLTARFTAVTFRQDRPAGSQPAGSPPAGVRPAPPVTAPAPLPSSATPAGAAGAKARVDSALEKGDAKDRKAAGEADAATGAPPAGARPAAGSARLKGGL
jgi:hypothetical protein